MTTTEMILYSLCVYLWFAGGHCTYLAVYQREQVKIERGESPADYYKMLNGKTFYITALIIWPFAFLFVVAFGKD